MMKKAAKYAIMGSLAFLTSAVTSVSYGATITASELIQDISTSSGRNLQRLRSDGTITTTVDDDPTIVSENSVSTAFGLNNSSDVTYVHQLNWLTHGTLTGALLEITAKGAAGNNDTVIVLDPNPDLVLGTLANGNSSTAILNSWIINLSYLADDLLEITIDKNRNATGQGALGDELEILSSKLSVTWETAPSRVPDGGATLALLGFALMGTAACRRKLGSKKN